MNIIKKVNQTRSTLKKYLVDEWHVDTIQDYSDDEIEALYNSNNSIIQFGSASGCNFTLQHKAYEWHKLHVIYYNFPELGKPPIKITKDCAKKIESLYESVIEPEDSIIVIIPDNISENLNKAVNELYLKGQEFMIEYSRDKYNLVGVHLAHLRNIHMFRLEHLTKDLRLHINVPKHICIRGKNEIQNILESINCKSNQLPIISRTDIQAKILRLAPGDVCKIIRITETGGELEYYRICK